MKPGHRIAWLFAFGYFAFYAPYSALIKLVTEGHVPGVRAGMSGLELLPATIVGTIVALAGFMTFAGWWQHLRAPSPTLIVSGIGTGIIIATTTIAYTFSGISIVFALLLMRCGVLILAPLVDLVMRRSVRWFCWAAFVLSIVAVAIAASDIDSYKLTAAAVINLAAYLFGYMLRLPAMTRAAKVDDAAATRRYFVTEGVVALVTLAVFPFAVALLFRGSAAAEVLRGVKWGWQTPALIPALLIGVLYAGLYVFGTLIYLDRRENTFCIPLNRAASLLAGVVAAYALAAAWHRPPPAAAQLIAVIPIAAALLLLSPAHHLFEFARAAGTLTRKQQSGP